MPREEMDERQVAAYLHVDLKEVRKLASSWFLKLFLPLSLIWRVVPALGRRLIEIAARFDAAGSGPRGYLLAEVRK